MKNAFKKVWIFLISVGPGIFGIGYTIGTGSVTTMSVTGADYGMQLLWVLALACLFSFVLMEAFGRYGVVTGDTTIHSFKSKLSNWQKANKAIAGLTVIGVVLAQWSSLSGILGLSASAVWETICLFIPELDPDSYWAVLIIAVIIITIMYTLLMVGRYSFFEKVLIFFVTIMGISFFISMFIVLPDPAEIALGFAPSFPEDADGKLMIAALVGTTMAAPTFVVRPLLMKGKGWGKQNLKDQRRDAITAAVVTFAVCAAIMITATGALHHHGLSVNRVLDMVHTLEPIAGQFAVALFMFGVLSAGLSSVFPIMMVLPWLLSDYEIGEMDTTSTRFRLLTGLACFVGLIVPVIGGNPIFAQILTQVVSVFILPLAIFCMAWLINQEKYMGEHKAGVMLNVGLTAAFIFACIISFTAFTTVIELVQRMFNV
ncbi:MAG: Nramp family divalent metal transporter [Balneolaceae bacterium]|nr:Nramp family divalent metal transporter [Balneolaceae bacterium]